MLSNWQLRRSSSKCSQWLIRLSVGMPDNPGRQGRNNNKGCQYNNLGSRLDYICCLIEFYISNDSRYSIRRPGLSQMIRWQRLSLWQPTMLPGVHMLSMRLNDMMAEVVIMTTYDVAWSTYVVNAIEWYDGRGCHYDNLRCCLEYYVVNAIEWYCAVIGNHIEYIGLSFWRPR